MLRPDSQKTHQRTHKEIHKETRKEIHKEIRKEIHKENRRAENTAPRETSSSTLPTLSRIGFCADAHRRSESGGMKDFPDFLLFARDFSTSVAVLLEKFCSARSVMLTYFFPVRRFTETAWAMAMVSLMPFQMANRSCRCLVFPFR